MLVMIADKEWDEALGLQRLKVAKEWSVYRGEEDSASIAARELAIAYLEMVKVIAPNHRPR